VALVLLLLQMLGGLLVFVYKRTILRDRAFTSFHRRVGLLIQLLSSMAILLGVQENQGFVNAAKGTKFNASGIVGNVIAILILTNTSLVYFAALNPELDSSSATRVLLGTGSTSSEPLLGGDQ